MSISSYFIPVLMVCIILFSLAKRVSLYQSLIAGARDGLEIVIQIIPSMVMIFTAVRMLEASGALAALLHLLEPVIGKTPIPGEILPMAVMRPISGSGALGILADNLEQYGPDSRIGRISSVIMGSTETTFYTLSVYFGAVGIKDVKRVLPCALLSDLTGVIAACLLIQ